MDKLAKLKRLDAMPPRGMKNLFEGGVFASFARSGRGIASLGDYAKTSARQMKNALDDINFKKLQKKNVIETDLADFEADDLQAINVDDIKEFSKKKIIAKNNPDLAQNQLDLLFKKDTTSNDFLNTIYDPDGVPGHITEDFKDIDDLIDPDFVDALNSKRVGFEGQAQRDFPQKFDDPATAKKNLDDIDADANVSKAKSYCKKNPITCGATMVGTAALLGYTATAMIDANQDEKRCINYCLPADWDEFVNYKKGNTDKLHPDKWITDISQWPLDDQFFWKSDEWANASYLDADKMKQVKPTYKKANAFMPRFYQPNYSNANSAEKTVWDGSVSTDTEAPSTYGFAYYKPKIWFSEDFKDDDETIYTIEPVDNPQDDGNWMKKTQCSQDADGNTGCDEDSGEILTDQDMQVLINDGHIKVTTQCEDGTLPDEDDPCELKLIPEEEEIKDLFCTEEQMEKVGISPDENGCKNFCKVKCQKEWTDYFTRKIGNDLENTSKGVFSALESILSGFLDVAGNAMSFEFIIIIGLIFVFVMMKN